MSDKAFWVESALSWCNMLDTSIQFVRYDVKLGEIDDALNQVEIILAKAGHLKECLDKLKESDA